MIQRDNACAKQDGGSYLIVDPACEVNERDTRHENDGN